jgi:hypothetical protein
VRNRPLLSGKIIEHLFQGDVLRTSLDIGLDAPFLVDTQLTSAGSSRRLPHPGSAATIRVDEASAIVFPGWSAK